jgi:glutamate-1-semialdehyde 2,1-aminomutase
VSGFRGQAPCAATTLGAMRGGVAAARVRELASDEERRFAHARPRSLALTERARASMPRGVPMAWMDDLYEHPTVWVEGGHGARFTDVDGHELLDFFLADHSAFCGHAPAPVTAAVTRRMARGSQFLLPGEDALVVAEALARRYGLPQWQFTLSATTANVEVLRLAREFTGRETVVVFDGKYHGHLDSTLVVEEQGKLVPEYRGLPSTVVDRARVVAFNDAAALERALAPGDVALVLAEPAMTNAGFLLPEPGFHDTLRQLTRQTGTLLCLDETHTLVCAHGGLTGAWGLDADFLTVGKSIAGGVPLGAYGMREPIAGLLEAPATPYVSSGAVTGEVATGGTLFANALSMAAARAALTEVLTPEAFAHTALLGERLGTGLRDAFAASGMPWSVNQVGAHCGYFFAPEPPADGAGARDCDDADLRALIRLYLANRGVWESGWWLGPTVSTAHTVADVDIYLSTFRGFLADVTG